MSRRSSANLPLAEVLLVICLVSLGFHLVAESLDAAPARLCAATAADNPYPEHDLADDQFILTTADGPSAESCGPWGASPLLLFMGLPELSPPVPPPDL